MLGTFGRKTPGLEELERIVRSKDGALTVYSIEETHTMEGAFAWLVQRARAAQDYEDNRVIAPTAECATCQKLHDKLYDANIKIDMRDRSIEETRDALDQAIRSSSDPDHKVSLQAVKKVLLAAYVVKPEKIVPTYEPLPGAARMVPPTSIERRL